MQLPLTHDGPRLCTSGTEAEAEAAAALLDHIQSLMLSIIGVDLCFARTSQRQR